MSIKNDEKYFVRNVKNYMVENKISNGKMAKRMGVSTSNVTSTLNGTFDISMNFVRRVSEATGLSIPQLFSPDPKQYGSGVEDVQDGNAVAMMELMKKQMEELKEENERLSDENEARLEDVKDMEKRLDESQQARIEIEGNLRKHIAELQKENKQREEVEESLRKRIKELQEENELHMANIGDIHHNYVQLREENEALEQENLRLVQEGYRAKNEEVYDKNTDPDALLKVDSSGDNSYIAYDGEYLSVVDVHDVDPSNKTAVVTVQFDRIVIE